VVSAVRTAGLAAALWLGACAFDASGPGVGGGDIDAARARDIDADRVDPADAAPVPDAEPDADAERPDADQSDRILLTVLTTSIEHGRLGNLTIKLTGPEGSTLAVISRPGFLEDADDGSDSGTADQYDASGDQSDFHAAFPIMFRDDSANDAEQMGHDLFGVGTAVCENDGVCDYFPNSGAVGAPGTFADAFAGQSRVGAWRLCVADSHPDENPAGVLSGWGLSIVTEGGMADYGASDLGLIIADDSYDGSLPTMTCHTIIVTP